MRKILIFSVVLCLSAGLPAQERLSLDVEKCREMALSSSESLQQSELALKQAGIDRQVARTAYLPSLAGSATGAYILPDMDMGGTEMRLRGMYMAGVTLTQPIYAGGKISTGKKLSDLGEKIAGEQLRMSRMDVIVDADNAYWTYVSVRKKVRMLESYLEQIDSLYSQVNTSYNAGMAIENDLLRVDAKRSDMTYQLQKARNGEDLCRMSLCNAIGVAFDCQIEPTDENVEVTMPRSLDSDISGRPELHLLEGNVEVSREQLRMTKADMLPTLGLMAGYTYYGNIKMRGSYDMGDGTVVPYQKEMRDGMGMAMLSLNVPIFHWGESRKKTRRAQLDLSSAQLEQSRTSKLLTLEARQAASNLSDAYVMTGTAQRGLAQAEENLRVSRVRYENAMCPLTDLLDAQSQWQQAHSNLIEAQAQYKINETAYLRATGRL